MEREKEQANRVCVGCISTHCLTLGETNKLDPNHKAIQEMKKDYNKLYGNASLDVLEADEFKDAVTELIKQKMQDEEDGLHEDVDDSDDDEEDYAEEMEEESSSGYSDHSSSDYDDSPPRKRPARIVAPRKRPASKRNQRKSPASQRVNTTGKSYYEYLFSHPYILPLAKFYPWRIHSLLSDTKGATKRQARKEDPRTKKGPAVVNRVNKRISNAAADPKPGKPKRRVQELLNQQNREKIERFLQSMQSRHMGLFAGEASWPRIRGYYVLINECKPNISGTEPKAKDKHREKPQLVVFSLSNDAEDRRCFKNHVLKPSIKEIMENVAEDSLSTKLTWKVMDALAGIKSGVNKMLVDVLPEVTLEDSDEEN
jgi:hypothetical protein